MSQRVSSYLSLHSLAVVIGITWLMPLLWFSYHANTMFTIQKVSLQYLKHTGSVKKLISPNFNFKKFCPARIVGDIEIPITYLNSQWKNTLKTQISFLVLKIVFSIYRFIYIIPLCHISLSHLFWLIIYGHKYETWNIALPLSCYFTLCINIPK